MLLLPVVAPTCVGWQVYNSSFSFEPISFTFKKANKPQHWLIITVFAPYFVHLLTQCPVTINEFRSIQTQLNLEYIFTLFLPEKTLVDCKHYQTEGINCKTLCAFVVVL